MELWEFNACVQEYSQMQEDIADKELALCWQTAAFTGAAFVGKLRKLNHYKKDSKKAQAPTISKDEFEQRLARAERRLTNGT